MPPLVTILINNYNYGRFLREAIDSALNQTYPNTEVIVVDDGSTDDSREIISSYGHRVLPVLKENGGQASAFNAGFAASHGEWILLLDSDDIFLPNKAQDVVDFAERNPKAGLIAHNLEYCGTDGAPIEFLPLPIRECKLVDDRRRALQGRLTVHLPATSGLCFRSDVLGQMMPMPETIRATADNYLKAVSLSLAPALQVSKALARQRIHGENLYSGTYARGADVAGRLDRALVGARIGCEIRRRFPALRKMAWRLYGRVLYEVWTNGSERTRAVRREIRARYSVVEFSPACLFHVAGAFAMAIARDLVRPRTDA